MSSQVVLLRGINLGPRRRIAMPDLRDLLAGAGFEQVRTYVQSGNVTLAANLQPEQLARECERLIAERFGFRVDVVVRTRDELAEVVERNPLAEVATNPKRYQVCFLSAEPNPATVSQIAALSGDSEQFVVIGREAYSWHPEGAARSKLWSALAGGRLGVTTTGRNWTTVTTLLAMADEVSA